ncbi:ABC transporter ATP-binding protein [Metabacillus sp. 84]|uniref:ABC transporter ATP-binding protein n=1 Tax=Metabacillus sp. 84 TaxID=3404705 RepID=UPI003CF14E3F
MSIVFKNVQKTYISGDHTVFALQNVSLEVQEGELAVILGPSGSGKSTLLNVAGGIDTADSGEVMAGVFNLHTLNEKQLTSYRREMAGFIFQSYNLLPALTVEENVEIGKEISKNPLSIDEILERTGMLDKRNKLPHQLSGGEQQRTAIARALVKNPKLLFCDEPTGALDEETGKKILGLLQEINQKYGTTVFIITHNPGIADMADKVIKMKSGKIADITQNDQPIAAEKVKWV